ncbi:sugar transferase [Vibrio sp.]|nr:sugar transferase [Vibrio sp.]
MPDITTKTSKSTLFLHLLGVSCIVLFLFSINYREGKHLVETELHSIYMVIVCYAITAYVLPHIAKHLLVEKKFYILPVLSSCYGVALSAIVLLRLDYARTELIIGYLSSTFVLYIVGYFRYKKEVLELSVIPNFKYDGWNMHPNINLTVIKTTDSIDSIKKGLVVDLHKELTPVDSKFVADCSIHGIPVFHSETIHELVAGKVQTSHLSENSIGTLSPDFIYLNIKRLWESVLILVSLPITLPVMLITAILIKLESPGPILFIQERVGQGGYVFKIFKFRSMTVKPVGAIDQFATQEQARVTKIGRVIRKVRIDELPQFFNVLKGDMSLIGPRPEQESFVKKFEEEISFYGYRHMVKPGITGWAQTVQGYADDTESTTEKLAHDLYYIKHLSFWLDMNIVIKTIRTMLTGFGAK